MAIRILLSLLALVIVISMVIIHFSFVFNVNLYEKYRKPILCAFGILTLFIVVVYVVLAILGLSGGA